jgi:hypothetical protein
MAPASDSDIAALLQASLPPGDAPREDVVLSEVRVLPRPPAPPSEVATRPPASLDRAAQYRELDARSAIIKAREAYRERLRLDTRRLPDIAPDAATPSRAPAAAASDAPPVEESHDSDWAVDAAIWRDDGDDGDFDAGVDADEADDADDAEDGDDLLAADAFATDDWEDDAAAGGSAGTADSWLTRGLFGGFGRFLHMRPLAAPIEATAPAAAEIQADELPETAVDDHAAEADPAWGHDPEAIFEAIVDRLPAGAAPAAPANQLPAVADVARFGFRPSTERADWARPLEPEPAAIAVTADAAAPAADAGDGGREMTLEDLAIGPALAPGLPRVCRTCRDFRPAEAGGRGWCANRWAFSHRRMVDAEDPAPCTTLFGSWWLPVDEVWSTAYDISSHGQSTPLLDTWLPELRDVAPQRRRS